MINDTQLNSSSVVIVSGGGRGITAQCVIYLAQQYHCKFILLGRSQILDPEPEWSLSCQDESELKRQIMQHLATQNEKPTPKKVQALYQQLCQSWEIKQTLSEIEKVGGKAEYCSVNVTDSQQVKATLRPIIQRWGEITGIIHGAGTLADKLIENKTEQDFDKVYSVKIDGLNSLLGSLEVNRLKFIALFSSFVSFYGNIGQSDYSLANEILNKYAYLLQQKYPKCHVVSIGWGPWDGGMVTPQLKQLFEQQNIKVIPQQTGAEMLAEELTQTQAKTPQIIVMSNPISPSPKLVTPQKHSYRLYRRLTLRGNPFVYDHVIGGNAVLPAMCALAWITNSCEQLYTGYHFLSCHNYQVLKGVVFDKSLANLYCLDLTEVDKTEDEIKFEALIWSETAKGIPLYHYRGIINITKQVIAERKLEESIQPVTESFLNLQPYQAGVLFHQPRFQGIKKILEINKNELVFNCYLPRISAQDQGQFSVQSFNSYTADLLFQCLLVWVRKHYNSGSLPLKLNELEQFSSLPFNQEFWIKLSINEHSDTKVIANALAYNSQGKIYLEATNMEVTLSSCLNVLFLNNTVNSSNTVCL
ncbi:MAG: SDR family NAD(P)-dependent oxidoreductase [Microcystis sp. M_OC_Ca_00000000_S217Cul]|uniref:SDR family NAD(P)-dependent oxidoreductase n=1 Tax=unclassified Microcystis TaxID=2643300 RepID=UPI0011900AE7|nr:MULTISPECIES: SDR family NAD(P)-dependent oxidoreductase [unclassified Microcystis]TRT70603.1 MAG: SDR family NAD(P)-dependent oxidoreductase [Microcystis sp. M_OC_Ca_00000000_S217Cul]TRT88723.1 MAG: SDR family NAD(P)-dependent oxidoreductase [Microcystis sp. M_OC_Ca_00000000_C217Col]